MEQASNTFNKGLLLDTHPMVLGNDSLTDCLNGTLVTMNGNEVVLQNDMGNRRVDNAFLPAGYEPVGIKEYGGIIYIAAYNPVTNRSQIGSFPSPERRIGLLDDSDLGGNIGPELFTASEVGDLNNLLCLDTDTILIPLTGKNSLHAGDKFVIYHTVENTWISKDYLSNYDNIYRRPNEEKIYSPKNKIYTALIGILNSQNNFVDITRNLCRWDINSSEYIDTSNKPDLYKFNVGYFIKKGLYNFEIPDETISDSLLLLERALNKATVNTYAYKLVGPMYMLLKVNHIQNFDFNIWGAYDKNNKILTLTIEGTATYNCPDSLINGEGGANDTYKTFELLESFEGNKKDDFIMFDLFLADDEHNSLEYIELLTDLESNKFYSLKKGVFTYDEVSNLYTARITKEYIIKEFDEDIFSYVIGVRSPFDKDGERTYLAGLSAKGQINISLLGSGDTKARRWQFLYNDDGTIKLRCNFDFYPKPDETLTNLTAYLTNVENPSDKKQIVLYNVISTGSLLKTITINGLTPKALYKVELKYTVNGETERNYEHNEFILTTKLFNDCFSSGSSQILDYGWPGGIKCDDINKDTVIDDNISLEIKTFKEKLRILPYISIFVDKNNSTILHTQEGSFIKKGSPNDIITVKFIESINPKLAIDNAYFRIKDLYPSFISANNSVRMKISNCVTSLNNIKEDIMNRYEDYNSLNINDYFKEATKISSNGLSIDINLEWIDIYNVNSQKFSGTIYNVFDSINNYINDHFDYDKRNLFNKIIDPTVILLVGTLKSGNAGDYHALIVGRLKDSAEALGELKNFYNIRETRHNAHNLNEVFNSSDYVTVVYDSYDADPDGYQFNQGDNRTLSTFKSETGKSFQDILYEKSIRNSIFLYAFEDSLSNTYERGYLNSLDPSKIWKDYTYKIKTIDGNNIVTRVWWRTLDDKFVLINDLLKTNLNSTKEQFKSTMVNYFGNLFKTRNYTNINNLMFCRYKEKEFLESDGFIYPIQQMNTNNNKPYKSDIPYTIYLTFSPLNFSSNLISISVNQNILNFYLENNNITSSYDVLKLLSDNKYVDLINNGFSNIFRLENIDMDGNSYSNINKIYNKITGSEIECNYSPKIFNNANEYQLLCKADISEDYPEYLGDYFEDEDSSHDTRTVLPYGQVPLFKLYNL